MAQSTLVRECSHVPGTGSNTTEECIKCGKPLPAWWHRDIAAERAITYRVAGDDAVANSIIGYSESRMLPGPWRDLLNRSFRRELLEELADARMYLMGWAQQRRALGYEDDLNCAQLQALNHLCLAWRAIVRDTDED